MIKSTKEIHEARERRLREEWGERTTDFKSVYDKPKHQSYFSKQLKRRLENATPFAIQATMIAILMLLPVILRVLQ